MPEQDIKKATKEGLSGQVYAKAIEEVLEDLRVNQEEGLSEAEVQKRREKYGENKLPERGGASPVWLFIKQFKDFLIFILFLAAGISWYAGQMANVYIILGVILFNAIMGFVQEYRAEKAVEAIKSMVKHEAKVLREGEEKIVRSRELVPGDIILLGEGQTIPADARLFKVKKLRIEESPLTGESEPVRKSTHQQKEDTPLANRDNMVWKGTHIVKGSGRAAVVATGKDTEIGKIATSLGEMEKGESNFRRKTDRLARKMALIAICTSAVVFALGYFYRDFAFEDILLVTIATMVSSIPEGLPVVISIVLAIGANRMAKRNAIIREFTATEVLGSVSTILSDKTGTITQSILTVRKLLTSKEQELQISGQGHALEGRIHSPEQEEIIVDKQQPRLAKLATIATYCNQVTFTEVDESEEKEAQQSGDTQKNGQEININGDPTEIALRILGEKSRIKETQPFGPVEVLDDVPFNSQQKFRATLVRYGKQGTCEMLVAGAPEKILELSTQRYHPDDNEELSEEDKNQLREKIDEWADQALRVLALACKSLPEEQEQIESYEVNQLAWTGLVGIIDPPRPGVSEAIADCKKAGIRVVMVTGDHKKTAAAIAEKVGIVDRKANEEYGYPAALSQKELRDLDDEEFEKMVRRVPVFARVPPSTKLDIAQKLQDRGELIGMTGDGVNDALALQKADVGIAMGRRGTDVAKDAAQVVLSDDNFRSIVSAIREGRIVFKNVKSTSYFLLTTNFASTATLMVTLGLGMPIPLTAVQILWVNMVTDGIMDIAKSTERGHGHMMDRPPIKKDEPILTWEIMPFLLIMAALMVALAVSVFNYYLPQGTEMARTGAFVLIAMTQVFNVFNLRDIEQSVFRIGLLSNKWINRAFLISVVLQLAVIKIPFLQNLFGFDSIPYLDFAVITLMSTSVLWAGELYKWVRKRM